MIIVLLFVGRCTMLPPPSRSQARLGNALLAAPAANLEAGASRREERPTRRSTAGVMPPWPQPLEDWAEAQMLNELVY